MKDQGILACRRGATAVEYALLISLLAFAGWVSFSLVGNKISSNFNNAAAVMPSSSGGSSTSSSSSSGGGDGDDDHGGGGHGGHGSSGGSGQD